MQVRADAARLRDETTRSAEELIEATRAALCAADTLRVKVDHARICGSARQPCLRHSVIERLQARLASQPAIEQAKGILMAREGCDPEEAFDILRRASQRSNRPVRDLAKDIVAANESGRRDGLLVVAGPRGAADPGRIATAS